MPVATCLLACAWLAVVPTAPTPITPQHAALAARYSRSHGGLCLLIEQNGRVIYRDESGLALDEPHRIYSGNKNFVALTFLVAAQEGLLKLDEPASLTLTEWRHDRRRAITIRQLLNQTGGLDPSAGMIGDARDQMAASVRARLLAAPGTRFHYGPSNYQALGEILRRKLAPSGRSVEDYMKERVFGPLYPHRRLVPRRIGPAADACGHSTDRAGVAKTGRFPSEWLGGK
jgi:CubicO group peptidase (beta-lactamase class C family)